MLERLERLDFGKSPEKPISLNSTQKTTTIKKSILLDLTQHSACIDPSLTAPINSPPHVAKPHENTTVILASTSSMLHNTQERVVPEVEKSSTQKNLRRSSRVSKKPDRLVNLLHWNKKQTYCDKLK